MIAAPTQSPAAPGSGTSLYVHVPFCVVKCGYCDFNSFVPDDESALDAFVSALDAELRATVVPRSPISVFIGGGTPTFLDERRLTRLFDVLAQHVDLAGCAEVTMEANPESVTAAKLALARERGVSRVSIGAQSFAAARLRFLDRAHDADRTRAAFAAARAAGFANVSLDLMFGLPDQTVAEWECDLAAALALEPDHLSCYNLTFEPGTRLYRDLQQGRVAPNDDRVDLAMLWRTRELLAAHGYSAYEISNFAGRGGPCRHNDHYWLQGDYVGVGPGAASHRAGVRHVNLKSLRAWADAAACGLPPVATAETLGRRERAAEALWLGLRRATGVDVGAISRRLRIDVERTFAAAIANVIGRGWVRREGDTLRLTEAGLPFADLAAQAFLHG